MTYDVTNNDQSCRGNGQKCRRITGTSDWTGEIVQNTRNHNFCWSDYQNFIKLQCCVLADIWEIVRMSSVVAPSKEFIVGAKYRLVRKIGSGSFGDIYLGINITNGEVSTKKLGYYNKKKNNGWRYNMEHCLFVKTCFCCVVSWQPLQFYHNFFLYKTRLVLKKVG